MMTKLEKERAKNEAAAKYMQERCWFIYANGKRCSMRRADSHESLCGIHSTRAEQANNDMQFGQEIVHPDETLDNARAVNEVLTRILRLAATCRITPRHAAVMAYLGQLIAGTLPQIRKEDELRADLAAPSHASSGKRATSKSTRNRVQAEDEDDGLGPLDIGLLNNLRRQIERMPDRPDPRLAPALFEYTRPKQHAPQSPPAATAASAQPAIENARVE